MEPTLLVNVACVRYGRMHILCNGVYIRTLPDGSLTYINCLAGEGQTVATIAFPSSDIRLRDVWVGLYVDAENLAGIFITADDPTRPVQRLPMVKPPMGKEYLRLVAPYDWFGRLPKKGEEQC